MDEDEVETSDVENYRGMFEKKNFWGMMKGLGLSVCFLAVGAGLALLITGKLNELVVILTITTLSIIASFFKPVRELPKTFELGMFFILIFSVIVASMFNIHSVNGGSLYIGGFVLWIIGISVLVHLLLCRIAKVSGDLFCVCQVGLLCSPPFVPPIAGAMKNKKVLISGIVVGLMLLFFIPGLVYGIIVGTIKSDKDVIKHMTASMKGLASYIVLVFFAAQFIYWFNYRNLGLILAINAAEFLKRVGFTGLPLIICFILLSAFLNLFMGSASAKWAILAPVFIPMFMLLDFHPGLTQASFRVGDSVTNVITPMMSYFALIVTYAQRYDEKYGIGTIISLMIPYTLIFLLAWIVIITIWVIAGFPLGFDGPLYLK
jgi:hypothetical protein